MNTPDTPTVTVKVVQVEQVGIILRLAGQMLQRPCEPSIRWAITVDDGTNIDVAAVFSDEDNAVEAAENLSTRLKALDGPKLATIAGETLQ